MMYSQIIIIADSKNIYFINFTSLFDTHAYLFIVGNIDFF
jgi:hypothetical protein